jgi:hypothetical protein
MMDVCWGRLSVAGPMGPVRPRAVATAWVRTVELKYEEGTQLYKLTEKGLKYLRAFDQISEMIAIDGGVGSNVDLTSMGVDALTE